MRTSMGYDVLNRKRCESGQIHVSAPAGVRSEKCIVNLPEQTPLRSRKQICQIKHGEEISIQPAEQPLSAQIRPTRSANPGVLLTSLVN